MADRDSIRIKFMKELLMSKPNGVEESNIIRANITVGSYTNQDGTLVYGYSNINSTAKFGQCSNSKILGLYSSVSSNLLGLTTPMVTSNLTITRLDTMYSISASNVDTTKNSITIEASPLFTQQDLDKTIPIQITFA